MVNTPNVDSMDAVRELTRSGAAAGRVSFDYFAQPWSVASEYPAGPFEVVGRDGLTAVFVESHAKSSGHWTHRVLGVDAENGRVWAPLTSLMGKAWGFPTADQATRVALALADLVSERPDESGEGAA